MTGPDPDVEIRGRALLAAAMAYAHSHVRTIDQLIDNARQLEAYIRGEDKT